MKEYNELYSRKKEGKMLSDAIKIDRLETRELLSKDAVERRRCYQEFKKVYHSVIYEEMSKTKGTKLGKDSLIRAKSHVPKTNFLQFNKRETKSEGTLMHPIQTLKMNLPVFGTEHAIVQPQPNTVTPTFYMSSLKQTPTIKPLKNAKVRDKSSLTVKFVEKLSKMEPKQQQANILDQTKHEIHIADTQLKEIHNMLNERKIKLKAIQEEKNVKSYSKNLPKLPTWGLKRPKVDRVESKQKRVMDTLALLNQRLQKLHEKYLSNKIQYRSVHDSFTQPENNTLDVLYQNGSFPQEVKESSQTKLQNTFASIKEDLDKIANVSVSTKPSDIMKKEHSSSKEQSSKYTEKKSDHNKITNVSTKTSDVVKKEQASSNIPLSKCTDRKSDLGKIANASISTKTSDMKKEQAVSKQRFSPKMSEEDHDTIPTVLVRNKTTETMQMQIQEQASSKELCSQDIEKKSGMSNIKDYFDKVDSIYKEIYSTSSDDDENESSSIIEDPSKSDESTKNNKSSYDLSILQDSVLKSNYLMNEFKITPNVKFFVGNDHYIRKRTSEVFKNINCLSEVVAYSSTDFNAEDSLPRLVKDLDLALKNSLYKVVNKEDV